MSYEIVKDTTTNTQNRLFDMKSGEWGVGTCMEVRSLFFYDGANFHRFTNDRYQGNSGNRSAKDNVFYHSYIVEEILPKGTKLVFTL